MVMAIGKKNLNMSTQKICSTSRGKALVALFGDPKPTQEHLSVDEN